MNNMNIYFSHVVLKHSISLLYWMVRRRSSGVYEELLISRPWENEDTCITLMDPLCLIHYTHGPSVSETLHSWTNANICEIHVLAIVSLNALRIIKHADLLLTADPFIYITHGLHDTLLARGLQNTLIKIGTTLENV